MSLTPPEPLDPERHLRDGFDCGRERLDTWLRASATQNQRRDAARTFVVAEPDGTVAGYYTLVASRVEHSDATPAVRRGMAKHFPIPVVLLARLAVDRRHPGRGVGAALLADAMRRTVRAAGDVGIRAVLVEAIDDEAAAFYRRYGFAAVTADGHVLMATIAQLRAASGAGEPPTAPGA